MSRSNKADRQFESANASISAAAAPIFERYEMEPIRAKTALERWHEKAAFMKETGATDAKWSRDDELVSLTLAANMMPPPARPLGPAALAAKRHEEKQAAAAAETAKKRHDVLFAASRIRPAYEPPAAPPSSVPRAVRAKEAARSNGKAR